MEREREGLSKAVVSGKDKPWPYPQWDTERALEH